MVTLLIVTLHLVLPINGLLYLAARRERERTQILAREALVRIANAGSIYKW